MIAREWGSNRTSADARVYIYICRAVWLGSISAHVLLIVLMEPFVRSIPPDPTTQPTTTQNQTHTIIVVAARQRRRGAYISNQIYDNFSIITLWAMRDFSYTVVWIGVSMNRCSRRCGVWENRIRSPGTIIISRCGFMIHPPCRFEFRDTFQSISFGHLCSYTRYKRSRGMERLRRRAMGAVCNDARLDARYVNDVMMCERRCWSTMGSYVVVYLWVVSKRLDIFLGNIYINL